METNPDYSSWTISKQFLVYVVGPLTALYRDTRELVVIIDALDECSNQSHVAKLLSLILKHSTSLPVKFFITSCPEMRLKQSFDKSWAHSKFILYEVEKDVVKADIDLYIKACLLDGQNGSNRHDWPSQIELERLVTQAGSLFIYAATVCKYIAERGVLSMPQHPTDVINVGSEPTFGVPVTRCSL